ncbi:MAG TPA: iron-sulfur cluster assembly scaffold protein [Anaerolineae bacterium]|nr:iron-sulfur cluster assembly scaffold protein [Anaerolineae bacterium]
MPLPYTETVMEHFRHPKNVGRIEDADAKAMEGSPACGDMVAVYLKVNPESKVIEDIKFESYGCASNIATGSIITELAKGKTIDEAKKITWKEAADALGGLPAIKAHCSVLAVDGLRAAIQNYEERHGLVTEKEPTTVELVIQRLKHVMNPVTGLDVVRTKLVKQVEVDNGRVHLVIDLPSTHQFAPNIREEIQEKIGHLWDVKQVDIEFTD